MEIHTKLDKSKFAPKFGTWWSRIEPFFDRGGLDSVYEFLKSESKAGKQIAPASNNTFRTFSETPYEELKAVIVLQDPYFTFKDGLPVADGIPLSCSITKKLQPSLLNFYSGIEKELFNGLELNHKSADDLSYLSKQGVLLLNVALTVEKDKPGSHSDLWFDFTAFLLKEVIAPTGVPVLFLGKLAGEFEPLLMTTNPTKTVKHPASTSYTGGQWDSQGAFRWLSDELWKNNEETIEWLDFGDQPF